MDGRVSFDMPSDVHTHKEHERAHWLRSVGGAVRARRSFGPGYYVFCCVDARDREARHHSIAHVAEGVGWGLESRVQYH